MNENLNKESVPTLGEIEAIYEDILRYEASTKGLESKDLGEFFKRFRKFEPHEESSIVENKLIKKYRDYLKIEQDKQKKLIDNLENLISYEKFFLELERKNNQKYYNSNFYGSNEATRYRVDKIDTYTKNLEEIIKNSPDAWQYYYYRQLMKDIQTGASQYLVEVSYVTSAKKKIIESLKNSTPVYIIGHLGSGKTQIAREAAIEFTLENIIQEELEAEMENWFLKNQNSSEEEAIEKFRILNTNKRNYYKNLLKEGNQNQLEKIYPYFISGSYNLTYEDMFVEKTLSLEKASANESNLELIDEVVDQYFSWLKSHERDLENISLKKKELIKSKVWDSVSEIFIARNTIYGTVVKKIEREILLAVRNGRPVIIDELNTIAMQNLIGLN